MNTNKKNNQKITKSNSLINGSYRLSLNELRIVLYGLSFINPLDENFTLSHRFSIKDIAAFYNIKQENLGSFYTNIQDALTKQFWKREFTYFDEDIQEFVSERWLIQIRYGNKNGTLAYHYNPLIAKELQNLSKRFTSYFLSNVANMKSAYSIRLYEIAVLYLNMSKHRQTTFKVDIGELKKKLCIENKYQRFHHLKARVLETAKREINKFSDISFKYEVLKIGRQPVEIKFTVSRRDVANPVRHINNQDAKALPEPIKQNSLSWIDDGKKVWQESQTGWDFYAIVEQFNDYVAKKGEPSDRAKAFKGFVKKKVDKPPT